MLYVLMPPGSLLNAPKGIYGLYSRSIGDPRAYLKWLRSQSSTGNIESKQNSHHQLFTGLSSGCHGLPNRSCGFLTLRYLYLRVPANPHTSLPARGQTSPARCVTIQQQSASSILAHSRRPLPSFFPKLPMALIPPPACPFNSHLYSLRSHCLLFSSLC